MDFVDNQVDRATDTIMVQLVADNADGMLVPGGYAKVLLTEKFEPAKIAVKVSAVMFEGEKRFVYVVGDNDVAERREIKTGVQIGDLQLVESGLSADPAAPAPLLCGIPALPLPAPLRPPRLSPDRASVPPMWATCT